MRIAARVAVMVLGVAGVAFLVAQAPLGALSADHALVIRAFCFFLFSALFLRIGVRDLLRLASQPDLVTAFGCLPALLPSALLIRSQATLPITLAWPVSLAAAAEECVYRLLLPHCIVQAVRRHSQSWVAVWGAFLIAQVGFAVSHAAISAFGSQPGFGWHSFFRLVGAGCLLASVRILAGLPLAIGVHALINLGISSRAIQPDTSSAFLSFALCLVASVHLVLTVTSHAHELVGSNFESSAFDGEASKETSVQRSLTNPKAGGAVGQ